MIEIIILYNNMIASEFHFGSCSFICYWLRSGATLYHWITL